MARSQLLVLLVAVIAYYATAQTCTTSDSQLTISPYTPTASGYRNELITPLTLNATVRLPQYTNYTWVVTQIPNGLGYQVFPDKMGILVTGTPAYAGSYTMNVFLFYYDTAVSKQRCSIQPIYFNIQCRTPFTISPSQQSGIQGTAYSPAGVQFQVTGGSGSGYSFSANFQNPQNGVNLTTAGALVGTWSAPQTFGFYLTIVDDGLCEDSFLYTVTVSCPTLTIAPISGNLPSDLTINYYNSSLTTSGGLAPYTYAIDFPTKRATLVQNSLPTGFNLASDGTVYGIPAAASTSTFSVVVADVNNCQGYGTFNLEIDCPTITLGSINGSTLVDKDYSSAVVASGGSAPYTYVIDFIDKRANNFGLPPGLTLASSGVISGKPIAIGTYLFTVLATDAKGCTQSNDYIIQVSCDNLAIGDITTTGIAATSYYASLTTTLGSGTYTYTTEDNLANDLVLSSSGILQGELKETGLFTFTVVSTDTRTCQATRQFTLNITCPTLVLANQIADQAQASKYYSSFAQCDDGVGPYTLVSATGLPDGMTASNFNFFGIPTEIGLFNVTIIAADTNDCVNTFYMPLNITCAAFEFDTEIDTSATVDASYSYKFGLTSGFIAPVSFDVSNGTLPRGLTLASDGTLSGTPTLRGDFPIIVRATDDNGCTGEYALTISVDCANSQLSVNPSLESGQTGVYYTDSFSASGSSHHPYSYSVTPLWNVGVQLPYGVQKQVVKPDLQGWTLCYQGTYADGITDSDLQEIGICAEENGAQYAMLACGTDADNFHNMAAGPIEVVFTDLYEPTTVNGVTWYWFDYNDGPTQASWGFADGSVQFDYEAVCDNAEGDKRTCWYIDHNAPGRAGYRCGDLIGDQATDLHRYVYVANQTPTIPLDTEETYTLLQNGTIYGLPTISGDLGYRVTVTDDAGCPASAEGVLHIDCGKFYVQDLPVSQVTITYLQSLIISGGSGFYSAVITGLPQGLTYDAEVNRLSGVPVEHGVYPIVIDITDDVNPCNYTVRTNITVLCPPNYMTDIPPVAKVGTTYLANINYINMVAPVHFETSSLLPYGLTLYRNGTIEGVPSLPGYYEFFINLIQDRPNGCSDGRWYAISVVCGPVDITDISNNFLLGDSVDETFDSSNGIQQYTYVVASGQLPDGLTLDPTGHLSGTVTKAGFFRFSVRATDTYNCVGERRFVVAVTCTEPIALGPLDTSFMLGEEVSMTPEILGGVAPYSFQLLLGTLPRGLALSTDGNITGNLTKVGAYVFQLGVRDSQGCVATELYTVTVVAPPTSQPPVTAPVAAPVTTPIAVPMAAPVAAPVVNAPVATGSEQPTPTPVPVAAPVDAPVEQAPIAAPVQAPVQSLVQAPTASPGAVSGQSSLHSAISVILSVCLIVLVSM